VHKSKSLQLIGWFTHWPFTQPSLVHELPSAQLSGVKKQPLAPHWSVVHGSPSVHVMGVCWHWPFTQLSRVQTSPSSQSSGVKKHPLGPH